MKQSEKILTKYVNRLADFLGDPRVFAAAVAIVIAWFAAKLFIEYDTWFDILDLVIFISSFFLLFVVQSSQNADTEAIQDKLDEIINSLPNANTKKEKEEKRLKRGETK